MAGIPLNPQQMEPSVVRQIVLARLRGDQSFRQLPSSNRPSMDGFGPYIDWIGMPDLDRLADGVVDVIWELILEGVLAPGLNHMNPNLPWFHRTGHGIRVLEAGEYVPNDPAGYLARLSNRVPALDPTVLAYLSESLETYRKGNSLASIVMLGIAAERVFLLIGQSLRAAISDPSEKKKLESVLSRQPVKPKLDWIERKIRAIEDMKPRLHHFPENAHLATMSLYDLLRKQRNELGHPREDPPTLDRHSAFTNLVLFPELYETAERVRLALAGQQL